MKKHLTIITLWAFMANTYAQTYDSSSLVDTNSTSTSTSTVNSNSTSTSTSTNVNTTDVNSTSTNTNNNNNTSTSTNTNTNYNINSGTQTFNNNNVNTTTSTNTNTNVNTGDMTNRNINTGDMTNRNVQSGGLNNTNVNTNNNVNTGDMTNRNINDSTITQKVIQPPPTAIAPAMMSGGNNDLCTTGTSGALQTQILGISSGGTVRDMNCERLKLSKTLYDMGMKVAAVATMCQDRRVFDAMWSAGTPCPYDGKIGDAARELWEQNPNKIPKVEVVKSDDTYKKLGFGALIGAAVFALFGL
jgi:hypothetical protein